MDNPIDLDSNPIDLDSNNVCYDLFNGTFLTTDSHDFIIQHDLAGDNPIDLYNVRDDLCNITFSDSHNFIQRYLDGSDKELTAESYDKAENMDGSDAENFRKRPVDAEEVDANPRLLKQHDAAKERSETAVESSRLDPVEYPLLDNLDGKHNFPIIYKFDKSVIPCTGEVAWVGPDQLILVDSTTPR